MPANPITAPTTRPVLKLKQSPKPDHFWLIWKVGGARPKKRQPSLESARTEALRISRLNPGVRVNIFEVRAAGYQVVPKSRTVDVQP